MKSAKPKDATLKCVNNLLGKNISPLIHPPSIEPKKARTLGLYCSENDDKTFYLIQMQGKNWKKRELALNSKGITLLKKWENVSQDISNELKDCLKKEGWCVNNVDNRVKITYSKGKFIDKKLIDKQLVKNIENIMKNFGNAAIKLADMNDEVLRDVENI